VTGPYGRTARQYHAKGWSPPPLPAGKKKPPPPGWTGHGAQRASAADVEAWCEDHAGGNIALWLPPGTIGVDVDAYKGPAELAAWRDLEQRFGPLPESAPWCSSRDDGVSGIRLFAVPADYVAVTNMGIAGEVIQHFHRYVVAPPSIHPDTGKPYRWVNSPDGRIPDARKLPPLPPAWLDGLQAGNGTAPGGGVQTGWTDPDVDALIEYGIPADAPVQDDRLRDVVWKLRAQQESKPVIRSVWQAITARTLLKDPAHPWTDADFERHWQGADRKQGNLIFHPPGEPPSPNGHQPPPEADDLAALAGIAAGFTPVDWHAAWAAKPEEIQWLIEPLIEAGQSVALYAVPGIGKSLIALELAAALATGRPVLGNPRRDPVTVVYIDVENRQPSLVERLQAFRYEPQDLGRLVLFSFPSIAALDSLIGGQQILALAVTHQAAVVIIDTTSRVVAGKENDADTYLAFYRHTVIPLRARGIALLRLDHPGKDVARGTRGSSAKKGDVDAEWLLSKTSELTLSLDRQKERDNHGDPHIGLRRHFEPLRHEVTAGSGDRAGELAAELDKLNVPPDAGRVIAGKALRDAGIKVRGTDLAAAIRRRKAIPWQPPLPTGQSDSQSAGTAGNRPAASDPAGTGSHPQHSGGNREPSPVPSGAEER
jgi:AAA domain/Bifunctional DNA primase/polymerase, N-terminal